MSPRLTRLLALLIPLACAAVFVRLGAWQLERGRARAAINAGLAARLGEAPVAFEALPADTSAQRWQRVSMRGRWRYDLEQVQAARTNAGSPGVHLLTPFERLGADGAPLSDTLVVVTRGWVYSPDAASAELGRWRERQGETVDLDGYALPLPATGLPAPTDTALPLRTVHRQALEARMGRPVAPVLVVMTSDSTARADSVPRRLAMPVIDPGPHRSYAIQWFAFALIAVVGGIALARRIAVG
jgi:surfeit locus 1 family protein